MSDNQSDNSSNWGVSVNDFGFTAVDDPSIAPSEDLKEVTARAERAEAQVKGLFKTITDMENLIMPLLVNLAKNPEKEYILWPNRKTQVETFIMKIKSLARD